MLDIRRVMKSSGSAIALILAVAAVCLTAPASSATIKSLPGKDGGVVIQIFGQIAEGDADAFIGVVGQAKASGKEVESVQLNSSGGKLIEGANIAAAIKVGKLATLVGPNAICASACFLAFAAGNPKFVGPGALVGVHKASERGGRETALSGVATRSMARFARELGVPSWIVDRMVTTSPRQIAWLDLQDLRAMGVRTLGDQTQTRTIATREQSVSSPALIPPSTDAPTWNDLIDKIVKLSAEQNNGNAALSRLCQPDLKNCIVAVAYSLEDGRQGFAVVVQDLNGKTMRREVCEFNDANDQRICVEWDTRAKHRDIKNADGDWVKVADQ